MAAASSELWNRDLPADIAATLEEFRAKSVEAFGDSLKSILRGGRRDRTPRHAATYRAHHRAERCATWNAARAITGTAPALENIATLFDPPMSTYTEADWSRQILMPLARRCCSTCATCTRTR